ncbi:hypothetical protein [Lentibacillus saliphilus]|uniref:hypothetical protein n=1 Tax=Lentibacillus saliphilus TaxID=2737028 RepID=UPI001C30E1D8|nr:hypothetical protein [Lentibacillus saliphilus]
MNELIELVSANFFIIVAVIIGLMGFLKDKTDKQEERKQPSRSQTQRTPSGPNVEAQTMPTPKPESRQTEAELYKQSQREALAKRMNVNSSPVEYVEDVMPTRLQSRMNDNHAQDNVQQRELKKQLKSHLTGKGIINGIVMSEILGQPRALKPYRSVTKQRTERL